MSRVQHQEFTEEFRRRFLAARMLWLFPALTSLLTFELIMRPSLWLLFIVKYGLLLGLIGWTSSRRSTRDLNDILANRVWGIGTARSHVMPLTVAYLLCGLIWSFRKGDARWFIIVGVVGGLIGLGLFLNWLVFDRWLSATQIPEDLGNSLTP